MIDSLIFKAQRRSQDVQQIQSVACIATVDGWQSVTIVASLEKFDIILLFLRYLEYYLIGIKMSTHVVKYFLC